MGKGGFVYRPWQQGKGTTVTRQPSIILGDTQEVLMWWASKGLGSDRRGPGYN